MSNSKVEATFHPDKVRIHHVDIVPEGEGLGNIELVNEEPPPAPVPHAHMDEH